MVFVLGVDGGTSKTIAIVARMDGTIMGMGRRAGSNMYDGGEVVLAHAAQAAIDALASAGVAPDDVLTGVFSMSGADWPEDFALIRSMMERERLCRCVVVVNDAVGGLYATVPHGNGVAVVCGSGVATAARNAQGAVWHTSFWQGAGGALALSKKALRAVYRAELGIDPPTELTSAVLDFFGVGHVEAVLHRVTGRGGAEEGTYAGLARSLLSVADGGDPTARRIVEMHGGELGEYALAAARRVNIERRPFALVLAGGVFRHPARLLADTLVDTVRATAPESVPVQSEVEPVVGALVLAMEHVGVEMSDDALINLRASALHEAWHAELPASRDHDD